MALVLWGNITESGNELASVILPIHGPTLTAIKTSPINTSEFTDMMSVP